MASLKKRLTRGFRQKLLGTARIRLLDGYSLRVHRQGDAFITPVLIQRGLWEPEETRLVQALLAPGMRFVDLGANLGYFSVLASKLVGPQGRVYAFEPEPRNHALLRANLRRNHCDNARCFAVAVSDEEGQIELVVSERNSGDHRLERDPSQPSQQHSLARSAIPVATAPLDQLLPEERIDLIKIDTQGSEAKIFRGMRALLERNPQAVILSEFWPHGLERAGDDPWQLLQLWIDLGYQMELIRDLASGRASPDGPLKEPITPEEIRALCVGENFVNLILRR